jgi:hypothetical protein
MGPSPDFYCQTCDVFDVEPHDHSAALAATQGGAMDLVNKEEEEKAFRRNLLALRDLFQADRNVRECLTAATREERKQGILHFTGHLALAGGRASLERAIEYLLEELEQMQVAGHSHYLVDQSTGKAVSPMTDDMVYQQPDFVNEAGQLVRGKKAVNPSVASAIGLAKQEQDRLEKVVALAKEQPHVYAHITDPDSIVRIARERLARLGVPEAGEGAVEDIVEVGREQASGVLQAPGRGFHRFELFAIILARRICQAFSACTILDLKKRENSKQRWYEVRVLGLPRAEAAPGATPPHG